MSEYTIIPTKKIIMDLRPLANKSTETIKNNIYEIRIISEKLLAQSKNPNPSLVDVILTQDSIHKTRKKLENCLNELIYRN